MPYDANIQVRLHRATLATLALFYHNKGHLMRNTGELVRTALEDFKDALALQGHIDPVADAMKASEVLEIDISVLEDALASLASSHQIVIESEAETPVYLTQLVAAEREVAERLTTLTSTSAMLFEPNIDHMVSQVEQMAGSYRYQHSYSLFSYKQKQRPPLCFSH